MNYFERVKKRLDEATLENSNIRSTITRSDNIINDIRFSNWSSELIFNNETIPIRDKRELELLISLFDNKNRELTQAYKHNALKEL